MNEATILTAVIGILGILLIPFLIAAILVIIAKFKIYKKAGQEGWKCLIPFYNTWTECEIIGLNTNWVWIILGTTLATIVFKDVTIISLAASIITLYFNVLLSVSFAQSFGKDAGFGVGLLFLPYVFYPILGFGQAEYAGAKPMKDIIFKDNNVNTTSTTQQAPVHNVTPQVTQPKFCTGCGAKLEANSKFCTSCGKQIN